MAAYRLSPLGIAAMPTVLRILDANANRAREALRVMEESARFVLDDASLSQAIKALRHDLAAALVSCPALAQGVLEANRDTPGDVGVSIKTADESQRGSVAAVAVAAGKRLSEALRVLEEYGKLLPVSSQESTNNDAPTFAAAIERLRYRGYDIEQRLQLRLATTQPRQWRVCVLISSSLCPDQDWQRVVKAVIEGGGDCVQLREKAIDAGSLLERARTIVALCRPHGVSVIINDRPDIALLAGADGVHLGQTDLPVRDARKLVGRQLLIGVSTFRMDQARAALEDGADYCGVGPMFTSTTKHKDLIVGPNYLREYLAWGRLPHLAIGGITPDNLAQLQAVGVRGIAVSSCVCASPQPAHVVHRLATALASKPERAH